MRQKLFSVTFIAILLMLFALSPMVASAHEVQKANSSHSPGSHIVVNGSSVIGSRTVQMDYPCPGQPHSGIGSNKTGDSVLRHGACNNNGVGPNLNSGPSCSGPVKLLVFVGGVSRFFASNSAYNVGSWVEYYWCPVNGWPNGLNWAKGHEYPLSGCNNLVSGNGWGANMQRQSTGTIFPDGDPYTTFNNVCTGNYVYDFSEAADGTYNYLAWMWGGTPAGSPSSCKAQTPGYA